MPGKIPAVVLLRLCPVFCTIPPFYSTPDFRGRRGAPLPPGKTQCRMSEMLTTTMPFVPHLRVLSLGAGVQSTTVLLMAMRGEIRDKLDCAIFADTGWEPKAV